jgi:acyl carrier protein
MDRTAIQSTVFKAMELSNQSREAGSQINISTDTALFGPQGCLDSMGLVALLIDIEDFLADVGQMVSLSDEKAMSSKTSPFKNVQSLVSYIESLINP